MTEPPPWRPRSRAEVRERLRPCFAEFGLPLRVLAEEIRGDEEAVIDWVAVESAGRAVVVLLDLGEGDSALLADGLTQRAWVAARLPDWLKLAPDLGVRPDLRPALLLLAPRFSRKTRIAAREADPAGLWLACFHWPGPGEPPEPKIELVRQPETGGTIVPAPHGPTTSFRTRLRDEDLGLTADERASLA